jgi:thiosulfate/3-mercaptopyruvate sulfurtransferase
VSLVSVKDLAARIDDPHLRIVDVRWYLGQPGHGRAAYDHGHLPGAVFLDLDDDLSAPTGPGRHPLPDPAVFARRLGAAGIGDGDLVVAYDDVGGWVAARLWWMLDDLGHDRAAVLDGGIPAWIAAGRSLTTTIPDAVAAHLGLAGQWTKVVDRAELRASLGRVLLLDARGPARYRGETEPVDAYPGHIPTARSAPTTDNLDPGGRFLPPEQLASHFLALGADRGPVVVSCGSGVSACHDSLAMRIAGLPDPILYPGSYSDWTRAGEPVVMGPDPGEPPRD